MNNRTSRNRSIKLTGPFRTFVISYILVLLIPLLSGIVSYSVSVDLAKAGSINAALMMLNQTRTVLEQYVDEVRRFTLQLASNEELTLLLSRPHDEDTIIDDVYPLLQLSRALTTFPATNDVLSHFYIYLQHDNVVVTPGSVYVRPKHYYALYHHAGVSFSEWVATVLDTFHAGVLVPESTYVRQVVGTQYTSTTKVISYLQSLPLSGFSRPRGVIEVVIDARLLESALEQISSRFGGWTFIADAENRVILTYGTDVQSAHSILAAAQLDPVGAVESNDGTTFLISTPAERDGWRLFAGIPASRIMTKAYEIRNLAFRVTGSTLIVGILISLFLAYRNAKPIHRLANAVRGSLGFKTTTPRNEYDFIQGNISRMISSNRSLEAELERRKSILEDACIKQLLYGGYSSDNAAQTAAAQVNVRIGDRIGHVCLIQILGYGRMEDTEILDELSAARFLIKQAVAELIPGAAATELESDMIAVIVAFDNVSVSAVRTKTDTLLKGLRATLSENYRMLITVGVGNRFGDLLGIARSYYGARQALYLASLPSTGACVWYDEIAQDPVAYHYPVDTELRLVNTIRAGDEKRAISIVDNLVAENLSRRRLSPEMTGQFIADVTSTLLKSFDFHAYSDSLDAETARRSILELRFSDSASEIRNRVARLIRSYCSVIRQRSTEADRRLMRDVIGFIEERISDPGLCLNMVADRIGRPEKFVSHLFKEQTGQYISAYIENLRIERAMRALSTTEDKIELIAAETGYNSPYSFRRAFKRSTGVTPHEFRETAHAGSQRPSPQLDQ